MAVISMQKYRVTCRLKIQFWLKLLVFLAVLGWLLSVGSIGGAQLSFILFVCFLVVFFFYLLFFHKNISIERRALLCVGNFFLLSSGVLMVVYLSSHVWAFPLK